MSAIKLLGTLLIMLSSLFARLGLAGTDAVYPLMPRQINLSGVLVDFSIPENFSKDMPADDMIERVNLSDKSLFEDATRFTLLRRWWDFKSPSFWKPDPGTLMMSILVQDKPSGREYNTLDRADFVRLVHDRLVDIHGEDAYQHEDAPSRVYLPFIDDYREFIFNGQRWLEHPLGGITERESYYIPLSRDHLLLVDFTFMKGDRASDESFYPKAKAEIERIMSSFRVTYPEGSAVAKSVEDPDIVPFEEVKKALKH